MKIVKNETFRDQIQNKWAEEFYSGKTISIPGSIQLSDKNQTNSDQRSNKGSKDSVHRSSTNGILHLCPRAGKIRTSIRIFCKYQRETGIQPKILICYPDKNIQKSWEDDFIEVGYNNPNIHYITHISLGKIIEDYDIIVCDEIHLLSAKQKNTFKKIMRDNKHSLIVGLSGTLAKNTELELKNELGLEVIVKYTLEEAIKDGIISDYKITVIKVGLDNKTIVDQKKQRTEKQKYNAISWIIKSKGQSLFLNLARMRLIHNSISKLTATKKLLDKLKDERVLVFCANNKIAKELGCKIHTSENYDQESFEEFVANNSQINHLAVCKIGNTGVSFRNLNNIVISAFDSNSENLTQRICRSLILDEPGKISNIYRVTSNEEVELKWLKKSLEFFDPKKIKYE
jgi:superfamily II DNA or RNA helicase